eukprot:tig00021246_g19605.t1
MPAHEIATALQLKLEHWEGVRPSRWSGRTCTSTTSPGAPPPPHPPARSDADARPARRDRDPRRPTEEHHADRGCRLTTRERHPSLAGRPH